MILYLSTYEEILLDDVDYERICKFVAQESPAASPDRWQATYCTTDATPKLYASKTIGGRSGKKWRMHRLIFHLRGIDIIGKEIDHKETENTLDNRWANLRIATSGQQKTNRDVRSDCIAGYKGVYRIPSGRWSATGRVNGKKKHLGMFDSPEEAALAYNKAAIVEWGPYARLNILKRPQ